MDPSIIRRSFLQELKVAIIRAGDDSAQHSVVLDVIRIAYEASGWDRKHRWEAVTTLHIAVTMMTAWKVEGNLNLLGYARLTALSLAYDLLQAEDEAAIRDLTKAKNTAIEWLKAETKNAPVATG